MLTRSVKSVLGRLRLAGGLPAETDLYSPYLCLKAWLRDLVSVPPAHEVVLLVAIRNKTWVEWTVYAACWLRKLGRRPAIAFSKSEIERIYQASFAQRLLEGGFWESVAEIPDVILLDTDGLAEPAEAEISRYMEMARAYAPTTAAYDLRVEEYEGWPIAERYSALVREHEALLAREAASMEPVFQHLEKSHAVRRMTIYSGLIGTTPAIGAVARRRGWDVVFCEGWAVKPGHMICSLNQPALVYDIEAWLRSLGHWDCGKETEIDKFLSFQQSGDRGDVEWLANYHAFQRSSATEQIPALLGSFIEGAQRVFLLAPNCVGDSATLRSQTIFRSQKAWIESLCDYFRGRPELRLIVRAHPDEEFLSRDGKLVVRLGELAEQAARGVGNIYVIRGSEDISTYSLIPIAQAGLIWMSTVGVDMVVRGCPVLAAAKPKYHGLGIVLEPESIEEYFTHLQSLAISPRGVSAEQKELGKKYLSILAKEFSYDAFSTSYRALDIRLSGHSPGGDQDTFYRILAGDLPIATRPSSRVG